MPPPPSTHDQAAGKWSRPPCGVILGVRLVRAEAHPVGMRAVHTVSVSEWMDALYDVQDTLMIPMEDELD